MLSGYKSSGLLKARLNSLLLISLSSSNLIPSNGVEYILFSNISSDVSAIENDQVIPFQSFPHTAYIPPWVNIFTATIIMLKNGIALHHREKCSTGLSGLTAYAGLFEICKPKKGEKVFVSAACGSVGNLVGQYTKHLGCYVVGCASSLKKVKLFKEKLGFDEAFNYNEEADLKSILKRYFPDGIDIYFDNVGAEMLEAAILNMNLDGRVAVCGVISQYTDNEKRARPIMLSVIYKRITLRGFLANDYLSLFPEFITTTVNLINTGKIHVLEDVSIGLESVPSAFVGLFRGNNVGKTVVQVSDN
ncbi:hypothetical protein L2E82_39227 [Cichorium intybus]|uniref:Uncharacterized protein n=1 Tax=Cichorium intybus TaxID=13427 RepID=A0ACB9AM00_CICIN|nr:hypothetical protein L2E82_39227 [Cichorium intybus]